MISFNPAIICTTSAIPQITIRELFSRQTCKNSSNVQSFTVPVFQRRFCWDKSQFQKLLTDITKTCVFPLPDEVSRAATNFPASLGQIVVSVVNDKVVIIDGQQRLTCVCLLLASTRDFITKYIASNRESLDESFASSLSNLALFCNDILHPGSPSNSDCILEPTYYDRSSFQSCMRSDGGLDGDVGVELLEEAECDHVLQAKHFFDDSFSHRPLLRVIWTKIHRSSGLFLPVAQDSPEFVLTTCASLVQTVLDRFGVLYFEVDSNNDVQSVFERLAMREAMLAPDLYNASPGVLMQESDLVRNLVTSFSPDVNAQVRTYQHYWMPIEQLSTKNPSSTGATSAVAHAGRVDIPRLDACICAYLKSALLENSSSSLDTAEGPKWINPDPGAKCFPLYQKLKECIQRSMTSRGRPSVPAPGDDTEHVLVELLQDIHAFAVNYFEGSSSHAEGVATEHENATRDVDSIDNISESVVREQSMTGGTSATSRPCQCSKHGTLCTECIIKKYAPKCNK